MVMQDAYILSHLLASPDADCHVPVITCIYDAIRRPAGNTALVLAKKCGKLTGLTDDEKILLDVKPHDDRVPHDALVAYIKEVDRRRQMVWDASALAERQCQEALVLLRGLRRPVMSRL